jgi:exodeoxyribonuclease-3
VTTPGAANFRLATWNVNSLNVRLPHLLAWLAEHRPDAMCLQELKTEEAKFPFKELEAAGYASAVSGQKTYNGVAILSRAPAAEVVPGMAGFADEQRRVIAATVGNVRVICVYCPNGQALDSDKYQYKLRWFAALKDYLALEMQKHPRLAVLGDFNVAPEDRDVHDPKRWEGEVHVSPPERAAFRALLELGFRDAFRLFEQPEKEFSWWDYRLNAFQRGWGLRIDEILLSPALAAACTACRIDRAPRALERPSDHAPVVADLQLQR